MGKIIQLEETYQVDITQVDFTGKASLFGISTLMQNIAAHHAELLGFNFYKEANEPEYYWVVSRVKYKMLRYPKWQEKVKIKTYPGGYDHLFAVRLFDLTDENGELIGQMIGEYVLLDAKKGRPAKIKDAPAPFDVMNFPYEGEGLGKLIAVQKPLKTMLRTAYYSEIDLNGHMNNAEYIKWIADLIDLKSYKQYEIESLQINYNKSVMCEETVQVEMEQVHEGKCLVSGISLDGKTIYFTAELVFKPILD